MERKKKTSKVNEPIFSAPDYIEPFEGRPDRDTSINQDDILNLTIALNSSETFNEFLLAV